jgi:predicted phosphodiesterase
VLNVQLALISDIHANFEALCALEDVLAQVDRVLCLGDLVGYYCQVNEVIDYIRRLNALCVLGNHEAYVLFGCPPDASPAVRFGIDYAERVLYPDHRRWLADLPLVWGGFLGGRSFLLTHGSPWRPIADYLYVDNPVLTHFDKFDYDVIAFGQTHRVLQRLERRPYLLSPGSVGQSRDVKAHACALILNTETMTVENVERAFDAGLVIDLALRNGAGHWVSKHLR